MTNKDKLIVVLLPVVGMGFGVSAATMGWYYEGKLIIESTSILITCFFNSMLCASGIAVAILHFFQRGN